MKWYTDNTHGVPRLVVEDELVMTVKAQEDLIRYLLLDRDMYKTGEDVWKERAEQAGEWLWALIRYYRHMGFPEWMALPPWMQKEMSK